jgi:dihydrofolate synthase/folylpolyglutamate synthase
VRPAVAVVGVSDDKGDGPLGAALARLAPDVVATRAIASPRAADPAALAVALRRAPDAGRVHVADTPAAALALARTLAPVGATVVVAGSLFLVGAVRDLLTGDGPEAFERWQ